MIDPRDVVADARSWLGTPYHHQGRVKGAGVDCVGVVIGVAHALGISDFDTADYGRQPDTAAMGALLNEHLDCVEEAALQPGDILWLRVDREPQHLAIVTEAAPTLRIIHAFALPRVNKVVETTADRLWSPRIVACFRFKGVAPWPT